HLAGGDLLGGLDGDVGVVGAIPSAGHADVNDLLDPIVGLEQRLELLLVSVSSIVPADPDLPTHRHVPCCSCPAWAPCKRRSTARAQLTVGHSNARAASFPPVRRPPSSRLPAGSRQPSTSRGEPPQASPASKGLVGPRPLRYRGSQLPEPR